MAKMLCPVCGDPRPYALWIDDEPPAGCPEDESWREGGPVKIRSVSDCPRQRAKAAQAAALRQLVPDAFDGHGNIKQGRLSEVLEAFAKAHPGKPLV